MKKIVFILYVMIVIFSLISCVSMTVKEENFLRSAPYKKIIDNAKIEKKDNQIIFSWQKSDTLRSNDKVKIDFSNTEVNDSTSIEYWSFINSEAKRNLIFFPANGLNVLYFKDFLTKLAEDLKLNIVLIHYRGYGNSSGKHSLRTCSEDNQLLYNYLEENFLDKKLKTDALGISVGSVYASKFVIDNEEISNLILMSPHSSVENAKEQMLKNYPFLIRMFLSLDIDDLLLTFDNIKTLKEYRRGLLIIQSEDDNDMTAGGGEQLFEASISKKKDILLFKDGGHFSPIKDKYYEDVLKRIDKLIYDRK